jgi:FtsH-binding integral membrane protein
MILLFITGLITFIAGAVMSYSTSFKASPWFMPGWIALALIGVVGWALITKIESEPSKLVMLGLYWDSLMQLTYILVPIFFFSARLSIPQTIGVILVFVGLALTRYHV